MFLMKKVMQKICIVGDPEVGKTSLIRRFVFEKYDDKYISTLGTKVSKKTIEYADKDTELTLMIWDVIGQKSFQSVHKTAFKGVNGAFVVCDLTKKETYNNLGFWISTVINVSEAIPFVILANKSDLKNKITVNENLLREALRTYNIPYFLTSAKTGENVEEAFKELGSLILERKITVKVDKDSKDILLDEMHKVQDEMISNFCNMLGNDLEFTMSIVRNTYKKMNVDFKNPSPKELLKISDRFIEIVNDYKGKEYSKKANRVFKNILKKYGI